MHVLVVEDDPTISGPLLIGLAREGFTVELAETGAAALVSEGADLVLLDLGLPDMNGREVCTALRARTQIPILIVSAAGDEIDRVSLLELGADDYVVKPFGFRELVARIRAVLRRTTALPRADASDPAFGALTIDERTREVHFGNRKCELTPREYELLLFLASDPGAVYTREQIMTGVWDEHWWGSTKTLDAHVASLRKKIHPDIVETVRAVGFRLTEQTMNAT
ncbi:MAG: response regulator transcription factor [Acidimicrobiia bacterium]